MKTKVFCNKNFLAFKAEKVYFHLLFVSLIFFKANKFAMNSSNPLISVIIPTFNRADKLKQAIDSVFAQTFTNFELIVIDDGSTDSTRDFIEKYQDRLRYFYQENQGPAAARNTGIRNARGRYIAFLDSDDLWLKNKLAEQVKIFDEHPEIKICHTEEIWIRNGLRVNPKKIHKKYGGWIYQRCLPLCVISPSSVVIHRDVFEKVGLFDESMIVCEDYDLWLRVCHFFPVAFIEKPLIIKYGGHADQLSRKFWGMDRFRVRALEKMLQNYKLSPEDWNKTVAMLQKKCDILINGFEKRNNIEEAKKYRKLKQKYSHTLKENHEKTES